VRESLGSTKPKGVMKVKGCLSVPLGEIAAYRAARIAGPSRRPRP
jgi:hypothetical protein